MTANEMEAARRAVVCEEYTTIVVMGRYGTSSFVDPDTNLAGEINDVQVVRCESQKVQFLAVPHFRHGNNGLRENEAIIESLTRHLCRKPEDYASQDFTPARAIYLHDYSRTDEDDTQNQQLPLASRVIGKDGREATLMVLNGGENIPLGDLTQARQQHRYQRLQTRIGTIVRKWLHYFKPLPEIKQKQDGMNRDDIVNSLTTKRMKKPLLQIEEDLKTYGNDYKKTKFWKNL